MLGLATEADRVLGLATEVDEQLGLMTDRVEEDEVGWPDLVEGGELGEIR